MEDRTFSDKLKIAREQHNLTRVQLAEQIGSSPKTIARWERGETLPRVQFHQKLCAALNTTPQELGLATETVEKQQKSGSIQHHSFSLATSAMPSMDESEKRLRWRIGMGIGIHIFSPLASGTGIDDQPIFIPGSSLKGFLRGIFSNIYSQEESYKTPTTERANAPMFPILNTTSPKEISPPEGIGNKALYGLPSKRVAFLTRVDETLYIPNIAENLTSMHQYAFASNFYGIILPAIFTIHLQIDIGEVITSMTNVTQIIHQVLSDPAWQGLGVVIGIVLPIIVEYKKKSSPVGLLFSPPHTRCLINIPSFRTFPSTNR